MPEERDGTRGTQRAGRGVRGRAPGRVIEYVVIILCSAGLVYLFGYRNMRFFKIPSSSMAPTLRLRDRFVTLNQAGYKRGDVVVLRDPEVERGYLVKRIIAVSGDTVGVEGGALFLNGLYASEPYVVEPMSYRILPVSVPKGRVFVLGDNRNNSEDSHVWVKEGEESLVVGSVSVESIIGTVCLIYYPLGRMGRVESYPLRNSAGG
jgi:signal peptidase I